VPLSYSLLVPPLKYRVQRPWLQPAPPADGQAIGNQSPLTPYTFRVGGFWQPQKVTLFPPPADVAFPNAPVLLPYALRPGGYWQPQKRWGTQPPADVAQPNAPLFQQYAFRKGGLWQFFRAFFGGPGSNPPIFTPYVPPPIGSSSGEVGGTASYSPMGSSSGEVTGTGSPAPIGTSTQN
jgi:hypothetical protein